MDEALLIVGEDKIDSHSKALTDLKDKFGALPVDCYGALPYIIAYTAAGTTLRLYSYSAAGVMSADLVDSLDFSSSLDRVKMLLVVAKLYALLPVMSSKIPSERQRMPFFRKTERSHGCFVESLPVRFLFFYYSICFCFSHAHSPDHATVLFC